MDWPLRRCFLHQIHPHSPTNRREYLHAEELRPQVTHSVASSGDICQVIMADTHPTSIVNLRHHTAEVNCGRGSIFGNPYEIGRDGTRDEVCEKFITYFYKKLQDPEFRAKVMLLKGRKLGCWCKCSPPCNNMTCKSHRCHVETIVEYLKQNEY